LDSIYRACLLLSRQGPVKLADIEDEISPFSAKSLSDKLRLLQEKFGITTPLANVFPGLKNARNCLTHRMGIVGKNDLQGDSQLILRWYAFKFSGQLPDGTVEEIPPGYEGGYVFKAAATLVVQQVERTRTFAEGNVLRLATWELTEIVWTVHQAATELRNATLEWAKSIGVVVTLKKLASSEETATT
jgi:hypothetical protein